MEGERIGLGGGGVESNLGASSGILGCSAGDELCVVVLEQVIIEAHVLFLR